MVSLIESLDPEKWQSVDAGAKGDGFNDCHVLRQRREDPKGTFVFNIEEDDSEPKVVKMVGCKAGCDPLKSVGALEIKLNSDGTEIEGLDVGGDIVMKK